MKASDLRIGNVVRVCYDEIFIADEVAVLEPDVVHLSKESIRIAQRYCRSSIVRRLVIEA